MSKRIKSLVQAIFMVCIAGILFGVFHYVIFSTIVLLMALIDSNLTLLLSSSSIKIRRGVAFIICRFCYCANN